MKNFAEINRASTGAKKNFNLIEKQRQLRKNTSQTGWLSRVVCMLVMLFTLSITHAYAANGDVLFNQDFGSATAVAFAANTAHTYTSSNYSSLCGTTTTSQFTTITDVAKKDCGLGINSSTGGNSENWSGKFGVYANNTSYYWSICKTSNFAATAPTAIKIEMNAAFSYVSSGSNTGVQIAVGSSFSSGLTNSCPALTNCVAGFSLPSNSTIKISKYVTSNGVTNLSSSTLKDGTSYKYTWIINNTASSLSYTDPKGNTSSVASGCWDLWIGNTLYCDDVTKATTGMSGTSLNNLYIGSSFGKKHKFVIDDIKVTDLTPSSGFTLTNAVSPAGYGTVSPSSVTSIPSGTATSSSTNTYTVNGTTVTATPAASTSAWTYAFSSWSGLPATVTAAATVTAIFSRTGKSYTITLDKDGGSGGSATVSATYGSAMPSAGAAPTQAGYTFLGYYTSKVGAGTQYYNATPASVKNSDFTSTATLYAGWKVNAPSITFSEDLSNMVTITGTAGASIYYTTDGSTPTSGSTLYSAPFVIHSDKTIKAIAIISGAQNSAVQTLACTHHTGARTFKSGETIYFKDASGNISGLSALWKTSTNNIYAYFWNDTENGWSTYGDKVEGSWNTENAIYKFTVPGSGKVYTKVLFTRGSAASWDGKDKQTSDQSPDIGQNMYIQNTSAADGSGNYNGSWSKYVEGAALIGDFNEWNPDEGKFVDGRVIVDLPASESFEFKVLVGDGSVNTNYWGLTDGSITNTTSSWWLLYSNQNNCTVTTGEAGEYCFHWDNTNHYIGVYYPQARFAAQQYIYFNVEGETGWKSLGDKVMFWTKYYDSGDNNPAGGLSCTSPLETYVYYAQIPNNDYIGRVQLNMYDGSTWKASSLVSYAYSRTSSKQNCMIEEEGKESSTSEDWTPQWTTYCPPMSSASLSDNSTTVIAGTSGTGTSENPFLVPATGTINVTASATSAVADPNMTKMFDFKVGGSSAQAGTGTTFSKGSLSNNTTYTITVDAYNTYNSTNGTKSTPAALYYKALNQYSVSVTATNLSQTSGATGANAVAHGLAYTATFTGTTYYNLPAAVTTVTAGGTDIKANCTWSEGTLTIPAAYVTGNIVISLAGTAKTTTLTLDPNTANHGTGSSVSVTATYAAVLPSFTKATGAAGYTLEGYYTTASGEGTKIINADGTLVASTTYTTADNKWNSALASLTLYARYEEITPTLAYNAGGGTGSAPTNPAAGAKSYNAEITLPANTYSKSGSTFVGWLNSTNNTLYQPGQKFNITENTTLTAQWDGTGSSITLTHFGRQYYTSGPRRGYAYVGSTSGTKYIIESDDSNHKNIDNDSSAIQLVYNNKYIKVLGPNATTTLSDSLFSGVTEISFKWKYCASTTTYTTGIDIYVGSTKVGTKSLTGNKNDSYATATLSNIASKNGAVKLVNTGTSSSNQKFYIDDITITCGVVPTAKTVTFNKGTQSGATGMPAAVKVPSGKKIAAPVEIPTVSNYIFDGWVTTSGGSTSFDFANTSITSNTTIYAKWTAKTAPTQYTFSLSDPCASATPSATLSGSQSGWSYQLYKNGAVSGDPKAGTGNALTWTGLTAGSYYVKTVETSTQASAQIGSSATVYAGTTITSNLSSSRSVNANVSTTVSITATGASLTYQWYTCNSDGTGKVAVDGKTTNSFAYTFTNEDAPTKYICCVVTGTCGTQTSNIQTVTINRTYYLTVDLDGGSWAGGISSGYRTVSTFNIPTPIPTKSGYVFLGWSFLGNTYQPGAAITPNQTATLRALWASPCFSFSKGTKGTEPTDGFVMTPDNINSSAFTSGATLSGGNMTNTSGATLGINGDRGFVMIKSTRELTLTLASGMFQEGTVITLEGYTNKNSTAYTYGFSLSGNAAGSPINETTNAYVAIKQRYVVRAGDGIEGTNTCTITMNSSATGAQTYLSAIYIGGCATCTSITPTLSYDHTTLYAFGGSPRGAVPTLTGNTGSGAVSYSSSNTDVVTVDSETGIISAVGCGTATVTATIASSGDYCGANATCNITVPALVTQTLNVASETAWGTTPALTFTPSDKGMEQVLRLTKNTFTFDSTSTSTKQDGTSKRWMTASFTGSETTKGKYLKMAFKNTQHNLRLGEVVVPIQPISNDGSAQVEIYEGSTLRMTSTAVTGITKGSLADVHFTFASPYIFAAGSTITVRIYFYGQTTGFRLSSPILVNGGVLVDQRFTDANSTGLWSDPANWDGGALPEIYHDVILQKPCSVDIAHATAKSVVIYNNSSDKTGKLTVGPNKGLEVAETVQKTTNGSSYSGTGEADLVLESNEYGNASLIFNNNNHCQATVQMYSKASISGGTWNWQYVGTPFKDEIPLYNYYGGYMYKWNGTGWDVVHGTDKLTPFIGYCLTQASATTHVMSGELIATNGKDTTITMGTDKDMVLANSWTAPIYIGAFTTEGVDATFTSTPANIYLFNTGMAEEGSEKGSEAGTYVSVPVAAAKYTGDSVIAPMQGFFVTTNGGSSGTITLKYDELVRPADSRAIVGGAMKAPRRERVDYGEPYVMKIWANGSEYNDRVVILAREDFSEGFDNGWDGEKLSFGNASPSVYVINEEGGYDAVSAIPEYEGTLVGFRPGNEDNVYTMTFEYNGEEVLYLNDLKAQMSAEIANGQTYMFTTEEGDSEVRFIISHNPIRRITTGVDDVETGTKARKVLINEKIYIIRKGRVYSVDGQIVK